VIVLGEDAFNLQELDGFVFDLDGVLTRTAELHADAWKRAFDEFLDSRVDEDSSRYRAFAIDPEYYRYIDGKPRYEGAVSFLESRGIGVPRGSEDDAPGTATACGIANRKNELYLEMLDEGSVHTYDSSIRFVEDLRRAGLRTGVVSSSRNCVAVLAAAGLLEHFDAKVDGRDIEARDLGGKPAPDIFAEAARDLDISPGRSAAVEDATAGVEAARAAGFACVIGLNRGGAEQAEALREHGAHQVVDDLAELGSRIPVSDGGMPLPVETMRMLQGRLRNRTPAVFLDYDGTLTPIVDRPEDAVLSDRMQSVLSRVSDCYVTAILSGRDLDDVYERVGLDGLVYAGSHGFDIRLPDGRRESPAAAEEARPALASATEELESRLQDIDGALVEHKRFAVTVHFRLVDDADLDELAEAVDDVASQHGGLRRRGGKKIIELLPDMDWDKGAALDWLLGILEVDDLSVYVPIYIGDDTTDEDAFAVLDDGGVSIAVGREPADTEADFSVDDVDAVRRLLAWLCQRSAEAA